MLWTGIALGAFLAAEALLHRLVLPLGLPGFAGAAITAVLIVALAVAVAELTRRHHRTVAGHAIRHGKRGAVASARHARRHGGTCATWLVAKAAPRWESREHRPLMFRPAPRRAEAERAAWTASPRRAGNRFFDRASRANTADRPKGKPPRDSQQQRQEEVAGTSHDARAEDRISPAHRARRAAARTGGSMPAAWGPVIALAADFEPEDDGQLLDWMNGQVTGMGGYGEALVDLYDHCTSVIGIDPSRLGPAA